MNTIILFLLLFFPQKESVELTVSYNTSYCGGARPSEEMLADHAKHRPLKNTTIRIYDKKMKQCGKVKTNAQGKASLQLPMGTYSYKLTSDIDKEIYAVNPKCKKAIDKTYGSFVVTNTSKKHELLFHLECDPCDPNMKKRQ